MFRVHIRSVGVVCSRTKATEFFFPEYISLAVPESEDCKGVLQDFAMIIHFFLMPR
jgi:hypothetical protein